jgi:hypothetical protein
MAMMMGNLHNALIEAGASKEKAQAAAEEAYAEVHTSDATLADVLHRVKLMQWTMSLMAAGILAIFYKVWGF